MKALEMPIWTKGIYNIENNEIWFVPLGHDFLCKFDLNKCTVDDIILLKTNRHSLGTVYNTYRQNNRVFMFPAFEDHIYVYEIDTKIIKVIDLPSCKVEGEKFLLHYVYEEWIYLFPVFYPNIIRINRDTLNAENAPFECEEKNFIASDNWGDKVYLLNETNKITIIDFAYSEVHQATITDKNIKLRAIACISNDKAFLSDDEGNIYIYNCLENKLELYIKSGVQLDSLYFTSNRLLLIPLLEKEYFISLDTTSHKSQKIELVNKDYLKQWPHSVFSKVAEHNGKLFLFNTQYRSLIEYDPTREIIKERIVKITDMNPSDIEKAIVYYFTSEHIVTEGVEPYSTLCNFIEYIKS